MVRFPSALRFVERSNDKLPSGFLEFLEHLGVEMDERSHPQLRMRATALEDWWFCWVEGKGSVRIIGDQPSLQAANWDLLMYSARGFNQAMTPNSFVPSAGQLMLSRPSLAGDIVSRGPFGYLCVFIPENCLDDVERGYLPYGRPISGHSGPGAIASASLRALVTSAMEQRYGPHCSALLPDVARLLFSALQQSQPGCEEVAKSTNGSCVRQFGKVLEFIQANRGNPELSVAHVARICGLSERSIHRCFAQRGESFGTHLQRLRLEDATVRLSAAQPATVTSIAYDCGFASASSFCRIFQRTYGVSPGGFRRRSIAET